MVDAVDELQSLILSSTEIRELTGWPDEMIEDYLNILRNIVLTATDLAATKKLAELNARDKADKIDPPVEDNIVSMDDTGNIKDSGFSEAVLGDVSNKADKISPATENAIIIQDASGNNKDSGDLIADLLTLDNAGSPEGVVTSNKSRLCVDTTGNQIYFNPTVGVNTGWVAV